MKNMYANICKAVKTGAAKIFVIGYEEMSRGRMGYTFAEAETLAEAKCIYARMKAEGHRPGIDVYTR